MNRYLKKYENFIKFSKKIDSIYNYNTVSEYYNKKIEDTDNYSKNNKCILIDGTSSAGKSYMTKGLIEKGWVIIGSDDFSGESDRKIPFDHDGEGYNLKAGEEFHKRMRKERKGDLGKKGATSVAYPGHPKNKEYKGGDPRVWYMYKDYLYGRGKDKNVIFDDIGDSILKYVPNCEYILLYTPLETLKDNVIRRSEKNDKRGEWVFSDQFMKRYVATENVDESIDPNVSYTKESLTKLLSDPVLQKSFSDDGKLDIDKFIKDLGIKKSGKKYWIKLRKSLKKGQEIFNTRNKTPEDLEEFISKI